MNILSDLRCILKLMYIRAICVPIHEGIHTYYTDDLISMKKNDFDPFYMCTV